MHYMRIEWAIAKGVVVSCKAIHPLDDEPTRTHEQPGKIEGRGHLFCERVADWTQKHVFHYVESQEC